ncbi:MAG: FkbM family methyltransferase [Candidatus Limnocylindria bacterium]
MTAPQSLSRADGTPRFAGRGLVGACVRIAGEIDPRLGVLLERLRWRRRGEGQSLRIIEALVRPGSVVLDIGANRGDYTWQLARLVGPMGHVHAIEPDPASVARLEALREECPNVTVHAIAASDQTGTATLYVPVFDGRRIGALARLSLTREWTAVDFEAVTIRVEPLDAILAPDGPPIAFVKLDVEGHEAAVIRGAQAMLRRSLPPLLVEIEQRHQKEEIGATFAQLRELGYVGYAVRASGLTSLDDFDVQRDQLAFVTGDFVAGWMPPGYVHDFLFVRPEADVQTLMAPVRSPARRQPAG